MRKKTSGSNLSLVDSLDGDCALLWKRIKTGEDQLQVETWKVLGAYGDIQTEATSRSLHA